LTESRSAIACEGRRDEDRGGEIMKRQEETSGDNRYVHYIIVAYGFTNKHMLQNSSNCTLQVRYGGAGL
jgi:hypothetical protein